MFNPFIDSLSELSTNELNEKIQEVSKKHFIAQRSTSNPEVQLQLLTILNMYKEEVFTRREKEVLNQSENGEDDLDKLINIS